MSATLECNRWGQLGRWPVGPSRQHKSNRAGLSRSSCSRCRSGGCNMESIRLPALTDAVDATGEGGYSPSESDSDALLGRPQLSAAEHSSSHAVAAAATAASEAEAARQRPLRSGRAPSKVSESKDSRVKRAFESVRHSAARRPRPSLATGCVRQHRAQRLHIRLSAPQQLRQKGLVHALEQLDELAAEAAVQRIAGGAEEADDGLRMAGQEDRRMCGSVRMEAEGLGLELTDHQQSPQLQSGTCAGS
eukprot:354926-Chlamydomonas_euryale.AAC.2